MQFVWGLLSWVLLIYLVILLVRVGLSWVQLFSRDWRPRGAMLVIAEVTYTLTDPPVRIVRKVVPNIRIGQVQLDVSFMIVFFACSFLFQVFSVLAMR